MMIWAWLGAIVLFGVIEAVTYEGDSYLRAYQWHPERLCGFDEDNLRLFEELIETCKK